MDVKPYMPKPPGTGSAPGEAEEKMTSPGWKSTQGTKHTDPKTRHLYFQGCWHPSVRGWAGLSLCQYSWLLQKVQKKPTVNLLITKVTWPDRSETDLAHLIWDKRVGSGDPSEIHNHGSTSMTSQRKLTFGSGGRKKGYGGGIVNRAELFNILSHFFFPSQQTCEEGISCQQTGNQSSKS